MIETVALIPAFDDRRTIGDVAGESQELDGRTATPTIHIPIGLPAAEIGMLRAGMALLDFKLCEARIIAAPGKEVERGRVTGISEQHGGQRAVGPGDGHHRHVMIDRSHQRRASGKQRGHFRFFVVAAVHSERRLPLTDLLTGRREF